MFVKAVALKFLDEVKLEVTFIDGNIIQYDMSIMFDRYPQLKALENRELFESGYLDKGGYGIIWNDELDFDAMSIYESGKIMKRVLPSINQQLAYEISRMRQEKNLTQVDLARLSGIDQADISKLERGYGNPSFKKIQKLLDCLNAVMEISITAK